MLLIWLDVFNIYDHVMTNNSSLTFQFLQSEKTDFLKVSHCCRARLGAPTLSCILPARLNKYDFIAGLSG